LQLRLIRLEVAEKLTISPREVALMDRYDLLLLIKKWKHEPKATIHDIFEILMKVFGGRTK
jgi:hypothetical protein